MHPHSLSVNHDCDQRWKRVTLKSLEQLYRITDHRDGLLSRNLGTDRL